MNYKPALAIIVCLAWPTVVLAEQASMNDAGQAKKVAEEITSAFDASYNGHDAIGISKVYIPDATYLPARPLPILGAVITGREGIARYFSEAFKTFPNQVQTVVDAGPIGDAGVWFVAELHLSSETKVLDGHVGGLIVRSEGGWQLQMTTANGGPPRNR